MRSLLLSLGLCALTAVALIGGTLAALSRAAAASRAQREELLSQLGRAVEGWDAVHAPASARRVLFLVMGEPDSDLLEIPQAPSPAWAALWGLLRSGSAREEHRRRVDALAAPGGLILDWYEQGFLWADEKRRRQDALAVAVGKARRAGAQVVLIADGRGAPVAAQALRDAPVASADQVLVDRMIVVGAGEAPDSARVGELIAVWHAEGDAVTPAGTQFHRRDAAGRRFNQALEGQAAASAGAAALIKDLSGGLPADESLKKAGQTPAAPAAPLVSQAPAAAPKPGAVRTASGRPAEETGALPSIKADSAASVARAGTVPRGWHAERIEGAEGPVGFTIGAPNDALGKYLANRANCANEAALQTASADALKPGCRVELCTVVYYDKLVGDLVNADGPLTTIHRSGKEDQGSEGALISKVTPSQQFGRPAYFFVKSRPAAGQWPAKDVYHFAISDKPNVLELRYEVSGPDPAACGRPYFDVFDKAAHSIAPER